MLLTNPWGFLALLGIPAVLLIHFLQRQAQVIPVSTLFLLEKTQRESTSGRRFDRLTSSIPLWLQLLMVLLLTWLLIEPRFRNKVSTQQVAIVLDSSASMSVFHEQTVAALTNELPKLKGTAERLQLYLLTSDPDEPLLYTGTDLQGALAVLENWQPTAGAIEPSAALRLARSRIRSEGILIYLTDNLSRQELPFEAQLLAVGDPTPNLGFTGLSFSENRKSWQATVRNYSDQESTCNWQVTFPDGSLSEKRELTLAPDGITTLTGTFPTTVPFLTVSLEGDAFSLDDVLPIVRPEPKSLNTESLLPSKFADFEKRFLAFFPSLTVDASAPSDLTLVAYDPLLPVLPESHSIISIDESASSRKFLTGNILAEAHALTRDLNWQALQVRETTVFPITATDQVLLWQGQRPLIVLREIAPTEGQQDTGPKQHLIFNFDLSRSNALKLPSTIVLLHRFTSNLRQTKIAFEARNTEINQPLELAKQRNLPLRIRSRNQDQETFEEELSNRAPLQAPALPGYFEILQGETTLLRFANHFADTREADLRQAGSQNSIISLSSSVVDRNSIEDRWWPLWALAILVTLLISWNFTRSKSFARESHPQNLEPDSKLG